MRHFHSYGPLDPEQHFSVPRVELVRRCAEQIVALAGAAVVSPEFPTGNGKVDLHLRGRDGKQDMIEVKSYTTMAQLSEGQEQAARYAVKLGLQKATLAVFVPTHEEDVLKTLSGQQQLFGVHVDTVAIGWG